MTKEWVKLNVLTTMFTVIFMSKTTGERVVRNYSYHTRIHISKVPAYIRKHENIDKDLTIIGVDNYKQQVMYYRMPIQKFIETAEAYNVTGAMEYLKTIEVEE